jgi:hypothetical protein
VSAVGGMPVPAEFEQARDALDRHLGSVPAGRSLESVGWQRPDPLTLYVPLRGYTIPTSAFAYGFDPAEPAAYGERPFADAPEGDEYLLRLYFSHYPDWPPSARFVNPDTKQFEPGDARWLPMISGTNELQVHASYGGPGGGQLICCSATLEFYLVNHSVEDRHRWRPGSNFASTLNVLSQYMRPPTYTGRQGL